MYNSKYKKKFNFKTLKKEDIKKISNIISNIGGIEIYQINTKRQFKYNKLVEEDKKEFSSFENFISYLDDDIKFLDELCITLKTEEQELVDLEYDKIFHNWELTFNKSTKTIDSLIYNIRDVFKINVVDLYKKFRWLFFGIAYGIQLFLSFILKENNKYFVFYLMFVLFISIINCFIKCRPYTNNKYIKQNKDNIIFFILGVVTPYVIDFIIKLLK